MSDIVELLRKWKTTESMRRSTNSLIAEAADEIERLVDELATMTIGLQAERVLADDLHTAYDRLYQAVDDLTDNNLVDDFQTVDARHRKARER